LLAGRDEMLDLVGNFAELIEMRFELAAFKRCGVGVGVKLIVDGKQRGDGGLRVGGGAEVPSLPAEKIAALRDGELDGGGGGEGGPGNAVVERFAGVEGHWLVFYHRRQRGHREGTRHRLLRRLERSAARAGLRACGLGASSSLGQIRIRARNVARVWRDGL
jgi:hypothetical protein